MAPTTGKARLFALDILRGIACCLVLVRHLPEPIDRSLGWSEYAVECVFRVGWCGVDLFFVLSGFLISSLLFKEYSRHGDINLSRFWVRRAFKIWPAYFVAYGLMVVSVLARSLRAHNEAAVAETISGILPNVLFFQNYCQETVRWPHSWSIAVEEHFYLTLPLLLTAVIAWRHRRGKTTLEETFRGLGVFLIGVCCLVLFFRVLAVGNGYGKDTLYYQTHLRMDALCFGVLLGYVKYSRPGWFTSIARAWPLLLLAAPAALLLPMLYPLHRSAFTLTAGFTILYLAFGGLVLLASVYPDFGSRGRRALVIPSRALAFIGVYSYTIYLAHSVVYRLPGVGSLRGLLLSAVEGSPLLAVWVNRLLFWTLSIGGGVLLARLVEQPFLRLRDRWYPSMRRATETSTPATAVSTDRPERDEDKRRTPCSDRRRPVETSAAR
jgi:peptidoglycan/LPS O-acetylase OafA/YrhL